MADRSKPPATPSAPLEASLDATTNPLARVGDGLEPHTHRPSADLIYETIMRGGGEAFGAPFEVGVPTLTERVVAFFKQKGFFGFESFEGSRPKRRRNRFTRHGSSRYYGAYDVTAARRAAQRKEQATTGGTRANKKRGF